MRRWPSCWSGAGIHTTQTAGLALANDLASDETRPRVVALLYVMLLLGMVVSALVFGTLLHDFTPIQLIQIIQGVAVITVVLNVDRHVEAGSAQSEAHGANDAPRTAFSEAWATVQRGGPCQATAGGAWASAPRPSACRTFCSSPSAARCSA